MAICSFALHLVPSSGELFNLLYELSSKVEWLIVIAPHKKPEVSAGRSRELQWIKRYRTADLTIDQRWVGMG